MRKRLLSEKINHIKNQSGFTITEILVVASIIGILAAAVIGNYIAMRPTRNMHAYGREMTAAMQTAKLEAVKRNTCIGIRIQPAAAPPVDLTGVVNRGSYQIFMDDGRGGGGACNAIADGTELANPFFTSRTVNVPQGVALTQSPVAITNADPNYDAGPPVVTDLFDSVSFNSRALVARTIWGGNALLIRNDPNPANATWWGRIVVNSLGGSMEYQTNNNPANEANWSE